MRSGDQHEKGNRSPRYSPSSAPRWQLRVPALCSRTCTVYSYVPPTHRAPGTCMGVVAGWTASAQVPVLPHDVPGWLRIKGLRRNHGGRLGLALQNWELARALLATKHKMKLRHNKRLLLRRLRKRKTPTPSPFSVRPSRPHCLLQRRVKCYRVACDIIEEKIGPLAPVVEQSC